MVLHNHRLSLNKGLMHKTNYQLASAYLEASPKVLLLNHSSYFIHTLIESQPTELLNLLVQVSLVS